MSVFRRDAFCIQGTPYMYSHPLFPFSHKMEGTWVTEMLHGGELLKSHWTNLGKVKKNSFCRPTPYMRTSVFTLALFDGVIEKT